MASGKPDVMMLLLNKLLDDGNVLYKVAQLIVFVRGHLSCDVCLKAKREDKSELLCVVVYDSCAH